MNWKAYEEIHFSDNNIQRWVREGDEYVNRMTLEQMGEFETKVRQQADRIAELEKRKWSEQDIKNACIGARLLEEDFLRIKAYLPVYSSPQTKPLSDEEIDDVWAGCSTGNDVIDMHQFARAILRKAQEK